ncbi:MAG: hypothetical protein HS107_09190 [Thermoflexaceae bacterium]|nr:hypothetical protein [Thermoflexaceae bacterium]
MALKKAPQILKAPAKSAGKAAPEVKAPPPKADSEPDPDRTFTHLGPGSGKAGAADPKSSAATLGHGKGAAPATEPKSAPPAGESKAAAATAETRAAPVETAGEALRARVVEENLKLGASDDDDAGALPGPRMPGSQSGDSGTANTGAGGGGVASSSGTGGGSGSGAGSSDSASSGTATSEGGRDPFGGNLTGRLDADTANALSQLGAGRPDLRDGLDVFQAAPGSTAATPGSGRQEQVDTGSARPNSGSDPEAEHAADVAGQVTGGRGSTGSMFGDRLADAKGDLDIMNGLLGDAAAKESSPSVASNDGNWAREWDNFVNTHIIFDTPSDINVAVRETIIEAQATPAGLRTGFQNFIVDTFGSGEEPASDDGMPPIPPLDPEAVKNAVPEEPDAEGTAGGGVGDPGDPDNLEGGKPTSAQMAFRKSLRDALGGAQTGSGDIDPADNGGVPAGGSHFAGGSLFAGAANNAVGLVGQPAGPTTGASGTMHGPTTGTDVDPVEGSAYSGPALGGNPEDLEFGSTTLGLDSARRSSSDDAEDSDEDDEDEDD